MIKELHDMNIHMRKYLYVFSVLIGLLLILIPPLQPAAYTISNTHWSGASSFQSSFEGNHKITSTNIPLSLLGDLNQLTDIIIIIGGSLPYYPEESQKLLTFVSNGGILILFEDTGYGRILTEAFGLRLGGTLIDQDNHGPNPYLPKSVQPELQIQNTVINQHNVIFNHGVRVKQFYRLPNTLYRPLFPLEGFVWEDKDGDGKFHEEEERVTDDAYLGGILEFPNTNGLCIVIGDSAFPTNDMISREQNREWLLELVRLITQNDNKNVLFDESRKLWIPPSGIALISYVSIIILGIFHSPLIAFTALIILVGILAIRKNREIMEFTHRLKEPFDRKARIPTQAYLQSAEEEVFSSYGKKSSRSNLYRDLIVEELLEIEERLTHEEKRYFEDSLRQRIFTFADYEKHKYQIEQFKKNLNEE